MGPHHNERRGGGSQRSYGLPPAGEGRPLRFLVRVRMSVLRQHLSTADHCEYTREAVEAWMRDAGFKPSGDYWLVEEPDLGYLKPSEVSELRPALGDNRAN